MSVNVGEDGQRFVQVEVEVPGSPEEVWQAIATGPGISSWFVPTEVEEREGGAFTANFGPGMESTSTISQWDPPRSYRKDGEGMDPAAPPVATEWIVQAKSGGTCIVRVVHSWFAVSDEWDGQWESVEKGWISFFVTLRLKLERFPRLPGAAFDVSIMANGSESEVWAVLTGPLGLTEAQAGQAVSAPPGVPALAGQVEVMSHIEGTELVLLTRQPAPGICQLAAIPMGDQVYLSVRFYLFGEGAAEAVAKAEPEWKRWLSELIPTGE